MIYINSYYSIVIAGFTYQFSRIIDSSGADQGLGVTTDSFGSVYISGYYTGTPTIYNQNGTTIGILPASNVSTQTAFVSKFDSSGVYRWTRIVDSASADQGLSVACDSSGNVYMAGYYNATPIIKDQGGTSLGTLPASLGGTGTTAFVCKFDSSGNYQYSRIVDSSGANDQGVVACDSSGNMYLTGFYVLTGTPTIKDQAGTSLGTLPTFGGTGDYAAFVCKFNSSGVYQYSRIVNSAGSDQGLGVTCDSSGNMYIAGFYTGTPTIKDQAGTSLGTLPASVGQAGFISKFDSSGTYQYSRIIDSGGTDSCQGVVCDSSSNVYVCGYYTGSPTISDQTGNIIGNLPTSTTNAAFICKFDSAGNYNTNEGAFDYGVTIDSGGTDQGLGVCTDPNSNVYVCGYYTGTPTIYNQLGTTIGTLPASNATSVNTGFVSKFNISGAYEYSRIIDSAGSEQLTGVVCDSSGNMYVSGFYQNTPIIRNQAGTALGTLPAASGFTAAFYCKFDSSGGYQDARIVDGTGDDRGWGIACDSSGNIFLAGTYGGSTGGSATIKDKNGNPTGNTLPVTTDFAGFVCKFNSSGTFQFGRIVDSGGIDQSLGVACDSNGNVYLCGYYIGTAVIKDQAGTTLATLPASTTEAAFCVGFTSTGTFKDCFTLDSASSDRFTGVYCPPNTSNIVYVSGYFTANPTLVSVNSGSILTFTPTVANGAGCMIKLDFSTFSSNYAVVVESGGVDQGYGVVCDSDGNVYFTGFYSGTSAVINFRGLYLSNPLPASVNDAAFVCKFSSSGVYQYSYVIDTSGGNDRAYSVFCDSSKRLYVTGSCIGTAIPLIKNQDNVTLGNLGRIPTAEAVYLCKFDPSANVYTTPQFQYKIDSTQYDGCIAVSSDNNNNYYSGGYCGNVSTMTTVSSNLITNINIPVSTTRVGIFNKYNNLGSYQFSRTLAGGTDSVIFGLTNDVGGNVYVAGYYKSTGGYYTQSGTSLVSLPAATGAAAILSKFDSSGNHLFSRIIDSSGDDSCISVCVDSSSNIYVAGYCNGTPIVKDQSGNTLATFTTSFSGQAGFMCKFNNSGAFVLGLSVDSSGADSCNSVAVDSSGNVYLAGYYTTGAATIRTEIPSTTIGTLTSNINAQAGFLIKLNSSNAFQYGRVMDGAGSNDVFSSVKCDSAGNIYASGTYTSATLQTETAVVLVTLPTTLNVRTGIVIKFNSAGTYQFFRVVNSSTQACVGQSVDVSSNSFVFSGWHNSATLYDTYNAAIVAFPASTAAGGFAVKFDLSGAYLNSLFIDSADNDSFEVCGMDQNGNCLLGGYYYTSALSIKNQAGTTLYTVPAGTGTGTQTNIFIKANL